MIDNQYFNYEPAVKAIEKVPAATDSRVQRALQTVHQEQLQRFRNGPFDQSFFRVRRAVSLHHVACHACRSFTTARSLSYQSFLGWFLSSFRCSTRKSTTRRFFASY